MTMERVSTATSVDNRVKAHSNRGKRPDMPRARSTLFFIWASIRTDRYAAVGALVILVFVISAILAPWIAPSAAQGSTGIVAY